MSFVTTRLLRESWPLAAGLLLLVMATTLLFLPTAQSLLRHWQDLHNLSYTHGGLIALICLALLLRAAADARAEPMRPSLPAAAVLAGLSVLWLIAYQSGLQVVHQALLPLIGFTAVWTALGGGVARRTWFVFAYLYCAIPLWSLGNGVLQTTTVLAVRAMLRVTGVSAFFEGNLVSVPAGTFEVAGGCSGLHFFIVAIALGALYGEIQRDSARNRIRLLALAALLAMVGNWIRVYTIVLAGHLTNMQHYLIQKDHYTFGWIVFAVMIGLFFFIAARMAPSPLPPASTAPPARVPVAGLALALVPLSLAAVWLTAIAQAHANVAQATGLPVNPGSWSGPLAEDGEWRPVFRNADLAEQGDYLPRAGQSGPVTAYMAVYLSQRQDKELLGFENSLLGEAGFKTMSQQALQPLGYPVEEWELRDAAGGSSLLWFYYQVGSQRLTHGLTAQLRYGLGSLLGTPVSRVVALRTPCAGDCTAARAALTDWLRALDAGTAAAE